MGKKFTKTMSFDDFKTISADTPEFKVNAFIDACKAVEKAAVKASDARKELIKLFLQRNDRFLFVYENLPSYEDFTPSQVINMMKSSEFWRIKKVEGSNSITVGFSHVNDSTTNNFETYPINVNDFIDFLNGDYEYNGYNG